MSDNLEIEYKASPVRKIIWAILFAGVLGVAGYSLWKAYQLDQASHLDQVATPSRVPDIPVEEARPRVAPAPEVPVPEAGKREAESTPPEAQPLIPPASLAESDLWLREQLPPVNPHPEFVRWINSESDLIRKTVLLVYQVAHGKVPRKQFMFWAPKTPFPVKEKAKGQYVMDPAGYHRYDRVAEAVAAIDEEALVKLYRLLKPLVGEAFAEFSKPGQAFETVLIQGIEHLLKTPPIQGEVILLKPSVMYKFADPSLENLSQAQKQLLRMGPVNAAMIKHKLGLIRGLLLGQPEAGA